MTITPEMSDTPITDASEFEIVGRLQSGTEKVVRSDVVRDLELKLAAANEALDKINVIRNSVIGLQRMDWSEHIYPLVDALNKAGMPGMSYSDAKGRFGTMIESTVKTETELAAAKARIADMAADIERTNPGKQ